MAVFWFGWTKKLKNIFTKKEADGLYLPKTFETEINELKRLTKLEYRLNGKTMISTGDYYINDRIDYSRPVYIRFKKMINNNVVKNSYSYTVLFNGEATAWFYLNENVSVRFTSISAANNKIGIEYKIQNLLADEKISRDDYTYTPKTLTTTINETQEEGV